MSYFSGNSKNDFTENPFEKVWDAHTQTNPERDIAIQKYDEFDSVNSLSNFVK